MRYLVMVALVLVSCMTIFGQSAKTVAEESPELIRLRAENRLLKATLKQRNQEIAALKAEVARLPADNKAADSDKSATVPQPSSPATPLDKWAGFRGLKWATNIADVPGMTLIKDKGDLKIYRWKGELGGQNLLADVGDSKLYHCKGDLLAIGGAKLTEIIYGFYKGRFYYLAVRAEGLSNWTALRDAVFAKYGKGHYFYDKTESYEEQWRWGGPVTAFGVKDVCMELKHNEISEKVELTMFYEPVVVEREADEAKKAKDARKDF